MLERVTQLGRERAAIGRGEASQAGELALRVAQGAHHPEGRGAREGAYQLAASEGGDPGDEIDGAERALVGFGGVLEIVEEARLDGRAQGEATGLLGDADEQRQQRALPGSRSALLAVTWAERGLEPDQQHRQIAPRPFARALSLPPRRRRARAPPSCRRAARTRFPRARAAEASRIRACEARRRGDARPQLRGPSRGLDGGPSSGPPGAIGTSGAPSGRQDSSSAPASTSRAITASTWR